jgi:hypothetical protein
VGAAAGGQRARLVAWHAERVGQVGAVETVPHAELDDLPVGGAQPSQRRLGQLAQLSLVRRAAEVGGVVARAGAVLV